MTCNMVIYILYDFYVIFLNVMTLKFKITSEKTANLIKSGFLQVDSMLEVYQEW